VLLCSGVRAIHGVAVGFGAIAGVANKVLFDGEKKVAVGAKA
jgi:hypothetical protein